MVGVRIKSEDGGLRESGRETGMRTKIGEETAMAIRNATETTRIRIRRRISLGRKTRRTNRPRTLRMFI